MIGLVNGLFVTRLKIPSFLVTLGMLLVVRGTALFVTDGFPQRTWNAGDQWIASVLVGDFYIGPFRIYMSLFWFIARRGDLLVHPQPDQVRQLDPGLRRQSQRGRAPAASTSTRTKVALFMLCSAMAALAGIISSIRTSAANPNSGTGYELEVIAMVVIGGTALMGGRGTIVGTVLGVFILRVMRNGIVHDRRAGPRLQHLHRRDHPRDDGAPLRPRTPAPGGDLDHDQTSSAWSASPSSTAGSRRSTT